MNWIVGPLGCSVTFFAIICLSSTKGLSHNSSSLEHSRRKLRAFVISLPETREAAVQDFKSSWQDYWPELEVIPVDAVPHRLRGQGIAMSFISAFQLSLYSSTDDDEISLFFEDDARPFNSTNQSAPQYNDQFINLVNSWSFDSPVLFLGGHDIQYNHKKGHHFPLTNVSMLFGMYGIAIRKLWLKNVTNTLRHHFASASGGVMHPDVIVSKMRGSFGHPCVVATPLLVDHLSNQYSDNWKRFRKKANWEGVREWWGQIKTSSHALHLQPDEDVHIKMLNDSAWCEFISNKYGVVPHVTFGYLPKKLIPTWTKRKCDDVFKNILENEVFTTSCSKVGDDSQELIAIIVASTSRSIPFNPKLLDLPLFKYMLPSLLRTIDCHYQYLIVIGYDKGDPFFDSVLGHQEITMWFEQRLTSNSPTLNWQLLGFENLAKKPGPVFIAAAKVAYDMKAHYFYRVNDDTEFVSRGWPSTFVKALKTLGDSVGVVGPRCRQGKTTILTHDFVSRTHMDIFDMNYYPPALTDWWLDDWMSQVYGQNRTMKSNRIEVLHHTAHQRRRYEVDKSISSRVNGLILEGQRAIKLWMTKNLSIETAVAFEKNVEQFKSFSIRDFPESVYEHLSMNESFHKISAWTHFLH